VSAATVTGRTGADGACRPVGDWGPHRAWFTTHTPVGAGDAWVTGAAWWTTGGELATPEAAPRTMSSEAEAVKPKRRRLRTSGTLPGRTPMVAAPISGAPSVGRPGRPCGLLER